MKNVILNDDCLNALKKLEKNSVDLIYLDPPFFTEKAHSLTNKDRTKKFSFNDVWGSGNEYGQFLHERISLMKDVLKSTGSIFVHCDKSGEHIVRAVLDSVFGHNNFQSEIIWTYKRWSNSRNGLMPCHQNIYFYSKSKSYKFNKIFTEYSETTNIDQILQKRTRDKDNKSVYKKEEDGKTVIADSKKGVPLSDVWDIPYLNPKAKERVGYPTQKPLLLLEQIIKIASDEGDLILDPFCGSGTTCVASKLLNRNYIGIDESKEAVLLSEERLANPVKTKSALLEKGRKSYQTADKQALALLQGIQYNPVQRNKGIDAILVDTYLGTPILVRVQKESEELDLAYKLLKKAMNTKRSKMGILIQTEFSNSESTLDDNEVTVLKSPALQIVETNVLLSGDKEKDIKLN